MNYPVELNFKKIALAQQATLTDAGGNSIAYARQKMFKLKEELEVFEDNEQSFGSIQRKGLYSIWKATYLLNDASGSQYATIKEEKPFAKVVDSLLGGLPFVGLVCNYIFNPSYILTLEDGTELFRLTKAPSFWGALFKIDKLTAVTSDNEIRCMMSLLMVVFLEKSRG